MDVGNHNVPGVHNWGKPVFFFKQTISLFYFLKKTIVKPRMISIRISIRVV